MAPAHPVLLYDGTCGFCAESVQLVLRHDRRRTLRFASLQGAFGRSVLGRHPSLERVDSIVWVEPAGPGERVLVRSDAALRIARYLGGRWRLAQLSRAVPRVIRDAAYDAIARHRHRILGSGPSCLVPNPDDRHRFLDLSS
jgi:predicted DCC family thiol-disulfide oxidoreductase YuxK